MKLLTLDKISIYKKMKIAHPCPVCGEVLLANKCKSCGYELVPQTPRPRLKPGSEKRPKKPLKGRTLF